MHRHPRLVETLRDAQRFGFFGAGPIDDAVTHAAAFGDAIERPSPGSLLVDLGSGGGLPGLVLADSWRDVEVLLIDRRQKRTDFLERAVRRLELVNTTVICADVDLVVGEVASGQRRAADVVTARGFGPPDVTLTAAAAIRSASGVVVVSEPPVGERWDDEFVAQFGLSHRRVGPVRVFFPVKPLP